MANVKAASIVLAVVGAVGAAMILSSRQGGGPKTEPTPEAQAGGDTTPPASAHEDVEKLREEVRRAFAGTLSPVQTTSSQPAPPSKLTSTPITRALVEKVPRLEQGVRRWQQQGYEPVSAFLEIRPFEGFLQTGDFAAAEATVDRALKLVERSPEDDPLARQQSQVRKAVEEAMKANSDVPPISILLAMNQFALAVQAGDKPGAENALHLASKRAALAAGQDPLGMKMSRVKKGVQELTSRGGDSRPIASTMSRLEPAVQAGNEREVEATLDEALRLLETTP